MSLARDLQHEFWSLRNGYQSFVARSGTTALGTSLPVFVFHTIEPAEFEADLKYLSHNGYTTLSLDEACRHLQGERIAERPLLLTIDDARSSAWRFGLPLLERYGQRAALFVIPGRTTGADSGPRRPTLADVWSGSASLDEVRALDPGDRTVCTWSELAAMFASGRVSMGSHSHTHARVFVDTEVVDVLGPWSEVQPYRDAAAPYRLLEPFESVPDAALAGFPLFRTAPLFAAERVVVPAAEFLHRCREIFEAWAPREASPGRLRGRLLVELRQRATPDQLHTLSAEERDATIRKEIEQARATLVAKLGERVDADCLCIPYARAREAIVDIAEDAGVRAMFWGLRKDRIDNCPLDDLQRIVRIKGDFVQRLPGAGRRGLLSIYGHKILRRVSGRRPY